MTERHVIVDACNKCLQVYEKGTSHRCHVIPDDAIDSMHIINTFNRTADQVEGMATALKAQDMTCKERVQDALIRATNHATQVDAAITEALGKLKQDIALSQFDLRGEIRAMNNRMDAIVGLVVTARDDIEAIQRDINELRYRVRTPPSAMPMPILKKRGGQK